jgi:hypothetical protein
LAGLAGLAVCFLKTLETKKKKTNILLFFLHTFLNVDSQASQRTFPDISPE